MKHAKTLSIAAVAAAALLAMQCDKNCPENVENYRDALFEQMLADTTFLHEERLIQEADSVAFYAHMEQPLLWPHGGDTTLRQMADLYNVCMANNAWPTDADTWRRYYEADSVGLEKQMLDEFKKMQFPEIADTMAVAVLNQTVKLYSENKAEEGNMLIAKQFDKMIQCIRFPDTNVIENEILPELTPRTYLPKKWKDDKQYDSIVGQGVTKPDNQLLEDLYTSYKTETNYNAKIAMLFMLMCGNYFSVSDTLVDIVEDAEDIFASGNYSPLLPVLWRAYRVIYCERYCGISTYSQIPNVRFNYYRRLVAYTMFRHVEKHPYDTAARVAFFFFSYRDNINRFGEFMFGNQSTAELISLFWHGSVL